MLNANYVALCLLIVFSVAPPTVAPTALCVVPYSYTRTVAVKALSCNGRGLYALVGASAVQQPKPLVSPSYSTGDLCRKTPLFFAWTGGQRAASGRPRTLFCFLKPHFFWLPPRISDAQLQNYKSPRSAVCVSCLLLVACA